MRCEIVQHVPGFVDTDQPPRRTTITCAADIPKDPWLGWHAQDMPWVRTEKDGTVTRGFRKFHRFSQCTKQGSFTLMVEREGGDEWWVVGYMSEPLPDLPEWEMTERGRARVDAWNRGATNA